MILKGTHCSSVLRLDAGYQFNDVSQGVQLISIRREGVDVSDLISSAIEEKLVKEIKRLNTSK